MNKPRRRKFYGRSRHRRGRPPASNDPFEKVEREYLVLLQKNLDARRKYFEFYHRADPRQVAKLERLFSESARKMQTFISRLSPPLRKRFEVRFNANSEDTVYSQNHDLDPTASAPENPENGESFFDPHILQTQIEADYSDDASESSGSMEDYLRYKGEA